MVPRERPFDRWRSPLLLLCVAVALQAACAPTDADLLRDIQARLAASSVTADLALTVQIDDGIVRLSGGTDTPAQQQQAMRLVRSVRGVKVVVNYMSLRNLTLAKRVKEALTADPLVGRIPIEVNALGDTVQLMSDQTNQEQRSRAVQIAAAVAGVGHVEDLMK